MKFEKGPISKSVRRIFPRALFEINDLNLISKIIKKNSYWENLNDEKRKATWNSWRQEYVFLKPMD